MGINKEMPTDRFEDDLKKPESKALKISKTNMFFVSFAIVVLQVADTGVNWSIGSSKVSTSQFSPDSFMVSAVIFGILKCFYDKFFLKRSTVCVEESSADEILEEPNPEDDVRQPATVVVDTMKVRKPKSVRPPTVRQPATVVVDTKKTEEKKNPAPNPKTKDYVPLCKLVHCASNMDSGARVFVPQAMQGMLNADAPVFVPEGMQCALNSNAPAFVPEASTLDSGAPVFVPKATAKKEKILLRSKSGGADTGAVLYRSKHWMNEVGSETKSKSPATIEAQKKSEESSEPVVLKKCTETKPTCLTKAKSTEAVVLKKSTSAEPVLLKKSAATPRSRSPTKNWQPVAKDRVMWASAWSDAKVALSI